MAQKYFADQFDDEEVLFVFRKHPVVMRKGLIVGLSALPICSLVVFWKPTISMFLLGLGAGVVLGALIILPSWITWYFSVFIVTDKRLIQVTQKGFFHKSVIDMGLNQIQMVNYQVSGLQETLLGFGTMTMQTFVGDLIIHEVPHPAKIQKKLLEILRQQGVSASPYSEPRELEIEEQEHEG